MLVFDRRASWANGALGRHERQDNEGMRLAVDLPAPVGKLMFKKTARLLYREYFVSLEQDTQGWRVVAIIHRVKRSTLLMPAFTYPDRATAVQYAKAAIDEQLSARRRGRGA